MLGSEEGAVLAVEVHFLLVAEAGVANPEILRVSLHSDIEEADSTNQSDGDGGYDDDTPIIVIEKGHFAEETLQIHSNLFPFTC